MHAAGVRTPPEDAVASPSSARHAADSPSIFAVSPYPGSCTPRTRPNTLTAGSPSRPAPAASVATRLVVKLPRSRSSFEGPSPGPGRTTFSRSHRTGRHGRSREEAGDARGHGRRLQPAASACPGAHRLAVTEVAPVGVREQRVGAPDDARVGRRQRKRPAPPPEVGVPADAELVSAVRPALAPIGVEGVGVGQDAAHPPVGRRLLGDLQDARDGASAEREAARGLQAADLAGRAAVPLAHEGLDHEGAEIRGDRIEPAAVHDAGPRGAGPRVVGVDHLSNELRLAGQVAVVRARFDACRHELAPVDRVRADRAHHDARVAGHGVERRAVAAVAEQDGDLVGLRIDAGERLPDPFELWLAPSGDRPGQRLPHAVLAGDVLGHQGAGEPGRSPQDDVEAARRARSLGLSGVIASFHRGERDGSR